MSAPKNKIAAFPQRVPFISGRKNFHLNFLENCRAETRTLVKTQQFMVCMKKISDQPKHFFTSIKPFVFKVFARSGFSLKIRWRRRC